VRHKAGTQCTGSMSTSQISSWYRSVQHIAVLESCSGHVGVGRQCLGAQCWWIAGTCMCRPAVLVGSSAAHDFNRVDVHVDKLGSE
jgi:hypothetical protein